MSRPEGRRAVGGGLRAPPPQSDELLSGYVTRAAHWNGVSAWKFVDMHWPRRPFWQRDPDRTAPEHWTDAFAALIKHEARVVEAMTLHAATRALGAERSGTTPTILSVGVHHTKRRRHGLQYCPDCLSEHPSVYRRKWRSGLLTACPRHGQVLRDSCPRCDAPLAPHRCKVLRWDLCTNCSHYLPYAPKDAEGIPSENDHESHELTVRGLLAGSPTMADMTRDLRTLLGLLNLSKTETILRGFFGMGVGVTRPLRGRFETLRVAPRRAMLTVVDRWTRDWPNAFLAGAEEAGLSQASFTGQRLGPRLALAVGRLPERRKPLRGPIQPVIHDPAMRRLARRDPALYRRCRAAKLNRLSE